MAEKLRVGVVGLGAMGKDHLSAYRPLLDRVEVVALCDTKQAAMAEAGEQWPEARRVNDYQLMLKSGAIDLLSICTMADTHCEIAIAAMEAGAHVLCEKPFAMNLGEADQMLEAATGTDRLIQVGTNLRHMGEAGILRNLVGSGELGRPMLTRGWTFQANVPWGGPHYVKRISSGGSLASMAVHIIDVALWVAGSPDPISVSASAYTLFPNKRAETAPSDEAVASYDVDDLFGAHVRLVDGSSLLLQSSWLYDGPNSFNFEMMCERGTVSLTPLAIVLDEGGEAVDRTLDYSSEEERDSWGDSVENEVASFVDAIIGGTDPSQTQREIRNVQVIQDGIYESADRGCEVRVGE